MQQKEVARRQTGHSCGTHWDGHPNDGTAAIVVRTAWQAHGAAINRPPWVAVQPGACKRPNLEEPGCPRWLRPPGFPRGMAWRDALGRVRLCPAARPRLRVALRGRLDLWEHDADRRVAQVASATWVHKRHRVPILSAPLSLQRHALADASCRRSIRSTIKCLLQAPVGEATGTTRWVPDTSA